MPDLASPPSVASLEQFRVSCIGCCFIPDEWTLYHPNCTCVTACGGIAERKILEHAKSAQGRWEPRLTDSPFAHGLATGFAVRRHDFGRLKFGEGAEPPERLVYGMTEVDEQ